MRMKKTIALVLAMMFALCAFVTAFADNETTTTTTATETTTTATESTTNDDVNDLESTSTTTEKADSSTTTTTVAASGSTTTTVAASDTSSTTKDNDPTVTLAPGQTSYDGQDTSTTTKKPANVDTTIPSTGSGIVVPALALLAIAASSAIVIKSKKED